MKGKSSKGEEGPFSEVIVGGKFTYNSCGYVFEKLTIGSAKVLSGPCDKLIGNVCPFKESEIVKIN